MNREAEIPALFFEQAACSTVRASPPFIRKYAHYMHQSGRFYFEQGLLRNAIYCLGTSYQIYEKPNWPEILINLCDLLGNALAAINELEFSFTFYKKLLEVSIEFPGESKQDIFLQVFLKSAEKLKCSIISETNPFAPEKKSRLQELLRLDSLLNVKHETVELFTSQDEIYCNNEKTLYIGKYDLLLTREQIIHQNETSDMPDGDLPTIEELYNHTQTWMTLGKMLDGDLTNPHFNSLNAKQKIREEILRDLWFYDEKQQKRKAILYTKRKRNVYAMESLFIKFRCRNPLSVFLIIITQV